MKTYQIQAMRTDFKSGESPLGSRLSSNRTARLVHGALGLATEVGEIQDILKKHIVAGREIDTKHLKEELGDVCWYMALILDEIGSTFDEVMQGNLDKLMRRYPQGFTEAAALEKADKKA